MPRSANTGTGPTATSKSSSGQASGASPKKPTPGNRPNGARPRPNAAVRARRAKSSSSWWWITALACVVAIGIGAVALSGGGSASPSSSSGSTGPELASASTTANGKAVDGIQCLGSEQLAFHDHAHLSVFVNGKQRTIPAGIGFAPNGSCLYWLHSHTPDGVIHMESPIQHTFTLGDYFAVWSQPLSATQVGPATGTVTAFVDGKEVTGDPSKIKLGEHVNIQLDVGKVVPFKTYSYGSGL